ncbi:hypothetical protein QBZ16_000766 [Prototheca wickerhamii]|uniref:Uncharacterized protein n=1 Tax=Prototheca wickerhamii TaxID=3111 RepID=A0AAD9MK45_PROWI|nr:hypothetical protein QBZ16_000766 [Prototheca wickerhamii]
MVLDVVVRARFEEIGYRYDAPWAGLQEALSGVKDAVDSTNRLGVLLSLLVTETTAQRLRCALAELGSAVRDLGAPPGRGWMAAQGFAPRPGTDQLTWQLLRQLTLAAVGRGDREVLVNGLREALAVTGLAPAEAASWGRARALAAGDPILAFFCMQVAAALRAAIDGQWRWMTEEEEEEGESRTPLDASVDGERDAGSASERSTAATPDLPAESVTRRRASTEDVLAGGGEAPAKVDGIPEVSGDSGTAMSETVGTDATAHPAIVSDDLVLEQRKPSLLGQVASWFGRVDPDPDASASTRDPASAALAWPRGLDPGPLDPADAGALVAALGSERRVFRQWVAATVLEREAERGGEPARASLVSLGLIPATLRALRASNDSSLRGALAGVLRQLARDGAGATRHRGAGRHRAAGQPAAVRQLARAPGGPRALSNVVVSSARNKREAAQFGAIHALTRMAEGDGALGREAAAATLGNLAASCDETTALMAEAGAVAALSALLDPRRNTLACAKALLLREGAVPRLVRLLEPRAAKAGGACSGRASSPGALAISSGIGSAAAARQAAASALSNLACNHEAAQLEILSAGAVPRLVAIACAALAEPRCEGPAAPLSPRALLQQPELARERLPAAEAALWALSNLCGGAPARKAVAAENGLLMPCVVAAAGADAPAGLRYAAVRLLKAIALARDCTPVWRHEALAAGVVPALVGLLRPARSAPEPGAAKAASAVLAALAARSTTARREIVAGAGEAVDGLARALADSARRDGHARARRRRPRGRRGPGGRGLDRAGALPGHALPRARAAGRRGGHLARARGARPRGEPTSDRVAAEAALAAGAAPELVAALLSPRAPVAEAAAATLGALCQAGRGRARRAALEAGALPALLDLLEQALLLPPAPPGEDVAAPAASAECAGPADSLEMAASMSLATGVDKSAASADEPVSAGDPAVAPFLPSVTTSHPSTTGSAPPQEVIGRGVSSTASVFAEPLQVAAVAALGALASEGTAADLEPSAGRAAELLATVVERGGPDSARACAAARALSDLACCGDGVRRAVAAGPAPAALVGILRGVAGDARAAAALALWDVCYDCPRGCEAVLKADGVPLLVQLLHLGDAEAKEAGAACLGEVAGLGPAGANAAPEQLAVVAMGRANREEAAGSPTAVRSPRRALVAARESDGGLLASLAATEVL